MFIRLAPLSHKHMALSVLKWLIFLFLEKKNFKSGKQCSCGLLRINNSKTNTKTASLSSCLLEKEICFYHFKICKKKLYQAFDDENFCLWTMSTKSDYGVLVFSVIYAVVVIIVYALVVTDVVVIINAVAVIVVRVVMNSLWSPSITVLPSTGQNRCNGNIFSSRHLWFP